MDRIYYTYILRCSDNSLYTGITNNIDRRLVEHNSGDDKSSYCFTRRPVKLVFIQMFPDVHEAIQFEKQIKGWSRLKKEALIEANFEMLKRLSECKNISNSKNFED